MAVGEEGRDDAEHRVPRDEEVDDKGERSFALPARGIYTFLLWNLIFRAALLAFDWHL